jgi:ribosomal protein S18 acetylase RimI-like enzyme
VQMAAYAQEAALLGAKRFPPLERTVQDLESGAERFLAVWAASALVGALGYEPGPGDTGMTIASLVVDPAWQRRGLGRSLVAAALARFADAPVWVSTGALNHPARALYSQFGFVEHSRSFVGPEPLEIIGLIRPAP